MNHHSQLSERARGRPVDTDQQDLKKQILNSAEELFADNGYAATSIRSIAGKSGVNPALVHYYFGNKKLLLQNVLERTLEPMGLAIAELKNGPDASPELIAKLLVSMAAKHPNIPRLLIREVFLPGGEMQQILSTANRVDLWQQQIITVAFDGKAVFETTDLYPCPGGGEHAAVTTRGLANGCG